VQARSEHTKVRPPAVAGQFYSADPLRLRSHIETLLTKIPASSSSASPKALIAPHAGYVYSGGVAATAFACLQGAAETIKRVVLIGPAHYVRLRGIAVPTVDAFETPLGRVRLDREALVAIGDLPSVTQSDAAHAPEHALEVEVPFLQTLLNGFTMVPLLVGQITPQGVADVLQRLWGGPETLILVSSDLSHYYDYDTARRLDAATTAAIERGDWAVLGPDNACGFLPVAGLLIEAERHGLGARRLCVCNSGDTAGSRDRVVGYGAWAFEEVRRHMPDTKLA
jgi:AmmeMemoRadiSam system protein B